jgi:kumamolisin
MRARRPRGSAASSSDQAARNSELRPVQGSERSVAPGATALGPLDPEEPVSATLVVRPRSDGPPLPGFADWQQTPPGRRRFLSADEFARNYGAAPADLELVAKFAADVGLTVVKSNAAARAVVVSGTAQQVNAAFGIQLEWYDAPLPPPRRQVRAYGSSIHHTSDCQSVPDVEITQHNQ